MKNYNWTTFSKKIAIESDLKTIYDAWTKPSEIIKWFLSEAIFFDNLNTKIDSNTTIETNSSYKWSWFLYDVVEDGKYIEVNGRDHLKFTFAGNCIVDVKLTHLKKYIVVELTQSNIPIDDESKRSVRLGCDFGWSYYLLNLKSVYEGGIDLRNKDKSIGVMLNN